MGNVAGEEENDECYFVRERKKSIFLHEVFIILFFVLPPFSKHLINVHLAVVGKNHG